MGKPLSFDVIVPKGLWFLHVKLAKPNSDAILVLQISFLLQPFQTMYGYSAFQTGVSQSLLMLSLLGIVLAHI